MSYMLKKSFLKFTVLKNIMAPATKIKLQRIKNSDEKPSITATITSKITKNLILLPI